MVTPHTKTMFWHSRVIRVSLFCLTTASLTRTNGFFLSLLYSIDVVVSIHRWRLVGVCCVVVISSIQSMIPAMKWFPPRVFSRSPLRCFLTKYFAFIFHLFFLSSLCAPPYRSAPGRNRNECDCHNDVVIVEFFFYSFHFASFAFVWRLSMAVMLMLLHRHTHTQSIVVIVATYVVCPTRILCHVCHLWQRQR